MASPREASSSATLAAGPVLLYDGECGVCSRSVQWILKHETSTTLRFAPLQSPLGRQLMAEARVPHEIDSMLWIEQDEEKNVNAKWWSRSVLATLAYVGGPWRALLWLRFIPRPILDFCYRTFARHRLKVAPRVCLIPPVEMRARFLDT